MARRKPRRHRRGEGTTYYDRTAKRWTAVLRLGTDPKTGKRRTVKTTVRGDRIEAEQALSGLRRKFGRGGDVVLMLLDDYLAEWLVAVKPTLRASTHLSYSHHVREHISPMLGGIRVGALHQRDVRRLIDDRLSVGLSASTVGRLVATLRSALGQAVKDGDLPANVAIVELPKVDRDPIEAMTPEDADRILEAVTYRVDEDGTEHGSRYEALYVLLLGTGMRLGEAMALDWRDLRLPNPGHPIVGDEIVFIRRGKTEGSTRTLPLLPGVVEALVAHRAKAKRVGIDEPVFVGSRKGERLRGDYISHELPLLMAAAGLPRQHPHLLRHGLATLLTRAGENLPNIRDVLGHTTVTMTGRYSHVSLEGKRETLSRVPVKRLTG